MSVLSNLEKGLIDLSDVSYNSIDKLMRRLAKAHDITPRELHDRFKAKHKMIPDDWAKKQMKINEEGLRDWFGKSKSKDGKPGWVQSDGSPCANEPGETGTPKCYSSAKKASMSKKELRSADTRKSRQDPGQQSKSGAAKPTYVSTDKPKKKMKEETFVEKFKYPNQKMKDKVQKQLSNVHNSKRDVEHRNKRVRSMDIALDDMKYEPKAYMDNARAKKASNVAKGKMKEETFNEARKPGESPQEYAKRVTAKFKGNKSKTYDPMKDKNFDHDKAERTRGSMQEAEDKKTKGSGSKDACYSKVKSRYSVWPSAYASGALVKCRKVGAANWGNSTKKEEFEGFYDLPAFTESQIASMKYAGIEVEVIDEACWKGYTKKGMKTMFGKRYPNCVKKEEVTGGILVQDSGDFKPREIESVDIIKADPIKGGQLQEIVRTKIQTGNMYQVIFGWRGKMMMVKLFFPDVSVPNRQKVADALDKMYPGSQLRSYSHSVVDYDDPYINVGEETIHEEKKKGEKYCRLCEKRETRNKCAYGGRMWDKYSVSDVDDNEKNDAASDSGISDGGDGGGMSEETNVNKDVENRMQSDENRKRTQMRNKMRLSNYRQNKNLPARQNKEETEFTEGDEMKGLTQKGGHKRSTDSGAGLTQKGVDAVNRKTGGNLKTAVTTPPSKLKPGSKAAGRRKSFCARSRGWTGERGKAARRRWNC